MLRKKILKKKKLNKKVLKKIVPVVLILIILLTSLFIYLITSISKDEEVWNANNFMSFPEFLENIDNSNIEIVYLNSTPWIRFKLVGEIEEKVSYNPRDTGFKKFLVEKNINVVEQFSDGYFKTTILPILIMLIPISFFILLTSKNLFFSKGKKNTYIPNTRLSDVAGISEVKHDIQGLVDYFKDPKHYIKIGAKPPKGLLLYGEPGTGKTLLAKAIAGEIGMKFFSASGSDFEEIFVGMGAARIRQLFKKARKTKYSLIFIDELDSIGSKRESFDRSTGVQSINALLKELSGIEDRDDILVLAATNRIESLDPALIREGRFDRKIKINLPDIKERKAILEVHSIGKSFDKEVSLDLIAKNTHGFTGASLETLLNESAFLACRNGHESIINSDIDEALDRILSNGYKKKNIQDRNENFIRVAYHEAGHAIVAKLMARQTVSKISILPTTSGAGGYTVAIAPIEKTMYSKKEIEIEIMKLYAGRAAEEILVQCKDGVTTGAVNDIEKATELIRAYITEYGMSEEFGMLNAHKINSTHQLDDRIYEISRVLSDRIYKDVVLFLKQKKDLLDLLAGELMKHEQLNNDQIEKIM